MRITEKINPANSLFGKIFVWFWITVVTMLVGAFFISTWLNGQPQIVAADMLQYERHQRFIQNFQRQLDKGVPIHRAFKRMGGKGRPLAIAVNLDSQKVIMNFPAPMLHDPMNDYRALLREMTVSEQVVSIRTGNMELFGPFKITGNNNEYGVFLGRLLKRHERTRLSFVAGLALMLTLGTVLCLFLAWRLSKPLKQMRLTTQKIQQGDLTCRVKDYELRQDEVGALARDFNAMTDKLASSLEQQQQLLGNVSHELRTPLTRLQLAIAMLYDKLGDDHADLQRIEKEISEMDRLIGEVLRLTRLSLHQSKNVHFETMRIDKFLYRLLDDLKFESQASEIAVKTEIESSAHVDINTDALKSAFENITRNGLRFANSILYVKVYDVTVDTVAIQISDDGPGIPDLIFEKLLQPFYYVATSGMNKTSDEHKADTDQAKRREHRSSGLGLAIANAAVKMHKGRLFEKKAHKGEQLLCGLNLVIELPRSKAAFNK